MKPLVSAAAFVAVIALFVGMPATSIAVTSSPRLQDVPSSAAQEDTIRAWTPCRRTLPSCVSKTLGAMKLEPGEGIDVDGRLDEELWGRAAFTSDFTQRSPNPGAPPTEHTEFSFVYTETALYVGARMYSQDPSEIRAIMSRRDDGGDSERLIINIDGYQNRRTYFSIAVTAAGSRLDWYTGEDANNFRERDYSWNPVWSANAVIDSLGWTAEMRIPFSQLRFNEGDTFAFGVNINRYIPSKSEDVYWIEVPRDEAGWPSWFGDLEGIQGIRTRRPVELVPYVTGTATTTSSSLIEEGDPFSSRSESDGRAGADLKMGIGPSLTLDATFNPDFGQVEADPAEVNLSAFPTFFPERRPFFVEGKELLEAEDLFYSRRIGARPRGGVDADYADYPRNTTILTAGKLTGRTPGGLSVGALGAVTAEESASTFDATTGDFGEARVQPATVWAVASLKQEFGPEASTLGISGTGVRRNLGTQDALRFEMNREAYSGQADWNLRIAGGTYELRGLAAGSYIAGTPEAIQRVQEFSSHYFQRPDADYVDYDTTRTSLSGYRASLQFERESAVHWLWGVGFGAISPGFDINDAGRLRKADRIEGEAQLEYRETQPGPTFQEFSIKTEARSAWNYGWSRQPGEIEFGGRFTLLNFWGFRAEFDHRPRAQSDILTRGGPSMGTGRAYGVSGNINSDRRKLTTFQLNGGYSWGELGDWGYEIEGDIEFKPGGAFQLSLSPGYERGVESRQYVDVFDGGSVATFGQRYVFAFIDYSQVSARLRVNYAFTPDISLEAYAEPFAASGTFSDYGELEATGSRYLRTYGTDGTTIEETPGPAPHKITVTDGDDTFSFEREDFRALSFRSNVVFRWEWRPNSTLFFVWQMNRGSEVPV
ncbi:MAG: DUF5916 domain-containing protein, partial [Gemmatimonadota bacterium]